MNDTDDAASTGALADWTFAARTEDGDAQAVLERNRAATWLLREDQGAAVDVDLLDHIEAVELRTLLQECATSRCLHLERVGSTADLAAHIGWHVGPAGPAPWVAGVLDRVAAGVAASGHDGEPRRDSGVIAAYVQHLTWLWETFGPTVFTTSAVLARALADPEGSGLRPGQSARQIGVAYAWLARSGETYDGMRIEAAGMAHGNIRQWRLVPVRDYEEIDEPSESEPPGAAVWRSYVEANGGLANMRLQGARGGPSTHREVRTVLDWLAGKGDIRGSVFGSLLTQSGLDEMDKLRDLANTLPWAEIAGGPGGLEGPGLLDLVVRVAGLVPPLVPPQPWVLRALGRVLLWGGHEADQRSGGEWGDYRGARHLEWLALHPAIGPRTFTAAEAAALVHAEAEENGKAEEVCAGLDDYGPDEEERESLVFTVTAASLGQLYRRLSRSDLPGCPNAGIGGVGIGWYDAGLCLRAAGRNGKGATLWQVQGWL